MTLKLRNYSATFIDDYHKVELQTSNAQVHLINALAVPGFNRGKTYKSMTATDANGTAIANSLGHLLINHLSQPYGSRVALPLCIGERSAMSR